MDAALTGPGLWYWSSVDLNGVPAGLAAFSRLPAPTAVPALIRSSSSVASLFLLRPQTLQKTRAMTPMTMAPPTPTTTPMTTFFEDSLRPELPEPPELWLFKLGEPVSEAAVGVEV